MKGLTVPATTPPAPSPDVLVREFHTTFGAPIATGPATLDFPRAAMRMALIEEEFCELLDAYYGPLAGQAVRDTITSARLHLDEQSRDVVEVTDAMGDLIYVLYGQALEASIPLDAALAEIHRSNQSKLGPDGRPILRGDGKVLKGAGYSRPDLTAVLERHATSQP
jgi:predicted HAD superfamily Cof-like phosphohydrolase